MSHLKLYDYVQFRKYSVVKNSGTFTILRTYEFFGNSVCDLADMSGELVFCQIRLAKLKRAVAECCIGEVA